MSSPVYRISLLLSTLLCRLPIGTNLAMFPLFWMLVSGRLLGSRGAVAPALAAMGLPDDAIRRAQAALAYGSFAIGPLLSSWQALVHSEGHRRPHSHDGDLPVACDVIRNPQSAIRTGRDGSPPGATVSGKGSSGDNAGSGGDVGSQWASGEGVDL